MDSLVTVTTALDAILTWFDVYDESLITHLLFGGYRIIHMGLEWIALVE